MLRPAESVPAQVQQWLQDLYRLPPLAPVDAFLIEGRAVHGPTETLLLRQTDDALELGLYLDPAVIARIEARGGLNNFARQSLEDFWTVLEGVSHFVCLGWHAENEREISALDLEVQAEIDKFVTAWEFAQHSGLGDVAGSLHELLFRHWRGIEEGALVERYRRANELAAAYCDFLQRRHRSDPLQRRAELREFFRLPPKRRRERIRALGRLRER